MCKKRSIALENEDEKWAETKHCLATNNSNTSYTEKREGNQETEDEQKWNTGCYKRECLRRMICLQE